MTSIGIGEANIKKKLYNFDQFLIKYRTLMIFYLLNFTFIVSENLSLIYRFDILI